MFDGTFPNKSSYLLTNAFDDDILSVSITDKDVTVDISGIYLAFTDTATYPFNSSFYLVTNGNIIRDKLVNNSTYKYLAVYPASQSTIDKINARFNIQVEAGNSVTEYEPYGYKIPITISDGTDTKTTNIYLDEPLRKIGDYADYIDFENKKVVRKISSVIIHKSTGYIPSKKKDVCWFSVYTLDGLLPHIIDTPVISKMFKSLQNDWWQNDEGVLSHKINTGGVYFSLKWERIGLVYDGTNVYKKEDTEKTKPLTDVEICDLIGKYFPNTFTEDERTIHYALLKPIEQSIELPTMPTLTGNVTYEISTSISPSSIEYGY